MSQPTPLQPLRAPGFPILRPRLVLAGLAALAASACLEPQPPPVPPTTAQAAGQSRLFSPSDLELLEAPGRDEWQQPERVMDELGIAEASRVADVGAGSGWFTARLAHRVGPNGRVFAEDIQEPMIDAIRRRVQREGLTNVELILGGSSDPRLPRDLRAILIVDAYAEFEDPVALLRQAALSLAPTGRLGIVDFRTDGAGGPGPPLPDRVAEEIVIRDATAAGLRLLSRATFLRYQYMLVFGR